MIRNNVFEYLHIFVKIKLGFIMFDKYVLFNCITNKYLNYDFVPVGSSGVTIGFHYPHVMVVGGFKGHQI